ncbi:MAG: ABC transporter permease subunit [Candidatus Aminicenantes bacterium]|jgi:ABC-2 type transport system permease protein
MQNIRHIFIKEFKSYFVSPIAYIVISVFLVIIGWLFFSTFFLDRQANLTRFFTLLPVAFAFVVPAVTMRLFSEEINIGSYEILLTLPVTFRDIIVGKFLAAVAFLGVMLLPTVFYAVSTTFLGKLDWGPVIGGYLGAVLLGAAYSSIGLLASSFTRNQVVAFIIGMAICLALTLLIDFMLFFLPNFLVGIFQYLSANYHFQNIAKGVIDLRDIIYFFTVSFVALYGTNLIMQGKK